MELGGIFTHMLEKIENLWGIHLTQEIINRSEKMWHIDENGEIKWKRKVQWKRSTKSKAEPLKEFFKYLQDELRERKYKK